MQPRLELLGNHIDKAGIHAYVRKIHTVHDRYRPTNRSLVEIIPWNSILLYEIYQKFRDSCKTPVTEEFREIRGRNNTIIGRDIQ